MNLSLIKDKIFIKDVIHDSIEITLIAKSIIDTPIFQRLRNLHQLGVCYLIFPNANNNRFEHSIGTYYLAGLLLEKLIKNSQNNEINKGLIGIEFIKNYLLKNFELEDTEENIIFLEKNNANLLDNYLIELIKIAGLVHDIGHGPFSHLFDEWLHSNPELENSNFITHETRSILLFKEIIFNNKIKYEDEYYNIYEFIDNEAFEFISELINPNNDTPKNFIFQIISNSINGLDVDKLDYLIRDSFYFGYTNPYDLSRIIFHAQIIDKNICFPEKISYEIYKVYRTRYDLHKQFYNHKTTICIEYMIRDILENLDSILDISKNIKNGNIKKFIELIDNSIFITSPILKSFDSIYEKWKIQIDIIEKIINKLNTRNMYKCLYSESFLIEEIDNFDDDINIFNLIKSKIIDKNIDIDIDNNKKNIITVKKKIGLISGNKSHPLDSIYFYDNKNNLLKLEKSKISHLMSSLHQEIICYIIYKK